jgi:hypothetical protein
MGSRPAILGLSGSKKKKSRGAGVSSSSQFKSGSRSSKITKQKRPRLSRPKRP